MKIKFIPVLIVVIYLFVTGIAKGQWVSSLESYNGGVTSLAKHGLTIFAGCSGIAGADAGEIFSSNDNGDTWNLITSGEIKNAVTAIIADDSNEFAGTDGGGLFRRNAHGGEWKRLEAGLSDSVINILLIEKEGNIIAGTEHGIYVSSNEGASWQSCVNMFNEKSVLSLTENDSGLFAGTVLGDIYFSSDHGVNWIKIASVANNAITCLETVGNKLFAASSDLGVFISTDGGFIWTSANDGLLNKHISGMDWDGKNLYVATSMGEGGAFFSEDTAKTWKQFYALYDSICTSIISNGSNIFISLWNSLGGVIRSTDGGESWNKVNLGGITNYFINSFAKVGSHIFAGTGGGGILRTTDRGKTWSPAGNNYLYINSLGGNDSIVLAGAYPGIWRSSDNGVSWAVADSDLYGACYHILSHDSTFYAAYGFNLHVSHDGGLTWQIINLIDSVYQSANDVAFIDSNIFVGTGTLGVLRSTNRGKSWIKCNSPVNIVCMAAKDSILFIGTLNGIYRSSDYGNHWVLSGLSQDYIHTIVSHNSYLFTGTDHGIYFSGDYGNTWTFKGEGLNKNVEAILILDSTVFAGTYGSGVWARTLSDVVTEIKESGYQSALDFHLSQNYPNPFNPVTNISYELPKAVKVLIKVYDILGREVAELVNEQKAAGKYYVQFNGSKLASGVYFYSISAGSQYETKKMILTK